MSRRSRHRGCQHDRVTSSRWRWRIGTLVVVAVVAVLVVRGADRPDDPQLAPPSTERNGSEPAEHDGSGDGERSPIRGFDEVAFRIEAEGATASTWCALLADEVDERVQGLSEQDDLQGYDGMVFRYDEPSTASFTMRDTRIPLSIAFFDEDGAFVSSADMDPCPPGTDCPSYAAEGPYLHALEVDQGGLVALGIGDGARLSFPDGPCPSA
jgi:uncharacterized membrane protein (UPF0127 family)